MNPSRTVFSYLAFGFFMCIAAMQPLSRAAAPVAISWQAPIKAELAQEAMEKWPLSLLPLSCNGNWTDYEIPLAVGRCFKTVPESELVAFLKSLQTDQKRRSIVDRWLETLKVVKEYTVAVALAFAGSRQVVNFN